MKYILLFYELKGKQNRSRKRIERYLNGAELMPIQQSLFLLKNSVENDGKIRALAKFLDKEGARVHVFKGEMVEIGDKIRRSAFLEKDLDERYQKLVSELRLNIPKIGKKWAYKRSLRMFETLKKKYHSIQRIDEPHRPSSFKILVEAEFENMEKSIFDNFPDKTKEVSKV